ncbi:hypothetical protein [Frankia tisae]|uniref:hypothetical protein n=1 Tax=Frankia tisae TaxID=2950104 RepID=UPI0021BE81EA|nr:hypothetical protein [Frankia tisae]
MTAEMVAPAWMHQQLAAEQYDSLSEEQSRGIEILKIRGDDTLRSRSMHLTFRKFCDTGYYPILEATVGRPYALYVHGYNDTAGAVRAVEPMTTGLRWRRLREPVTVIGTPEAKGQEACWELGATTAASLMPV